MDAKSRKERLRKVVRSLMMSGEAAEPSLQSPGTSPRAAVVATVKGVSVAAMRAWCIYHLHIGFEQCFIYFDDPLEWREVSRELPADGVQSFAVDDTLRCQWQSLAAADDWLTHAATEVQARQALNALHALARCSEAGLTWLLHIDADELFYCNSSDDVRKHFAELDARGVHCFTYCNLEAVPETTEGCRDGHPFSQVTLFKRNPTVLPSTSDAQDAVASWERRTGGNFFLFYTSGKSAVRVHPRARPLSVHEWIPGTVSGLSRGWFSALGSTDFVHHWPTQTSVILHFACCDAATLWQRQQGGGSRYLLRGHFTPPRIYEQAVGLSVGCEDCTGPMPDHAAAAASDEFSDALRPDSESSPPLRQLIAQLFERTVALCDKEESRRQVDAGVCVRIILRRDLFVMSHARSHE